MLDYIRSSAGSWLIKFILGAIVVVFIFWGVGTFRSERIDILAEVNGDEILVQDYREAYSNTLERYRQMFGGQLPEGILEKLNVKQQVIDGLINDVLIRKAAAELGVSVSDEEIQETILEIPAFKVNGVFDMSTYQRALRGAHLTPEGFEARVRQELITGRMRLLLSSGLAVPEREAMDHFLYENEEVNLAFVALEPSHCEPQVRVDAADLEAWYEAKKQGYETEPQVSVQYLAFKRIDLETEVELNDEEVKAFYEENQEKYVVKERRQARHILLKVDKDADEETVSKVQAKAGALLERIKKGEDFAKLAKESSEDPGSAGKGGDLGLFGRGAMVPAFEKEAFALKVGEVSEPVRSRFGWHIIKLEKIEPERTKPLEEVENTISADLRKKKADELAMDQARAAYDEILQLGSLNAYAERHKLQLEETDFFGQGTPPAVFGTDQDLVRTMFALEKGELSSLLRVPVGVLILEVLDKKAPYVPPLEEVQERARKDFVREKAQELCKEKASALLKAARLGDLPTVAKAQGLEVQETGQFKRTDRTAGGKLPENVVQAGLSLDKSKPYPDEILEGGGQFFVLGYLGRKEADPAAFEGEKEALTQRILSQKQQRVFQDWLNALRAKATIKMVQEL